MIWCIIAMAMAASVPGCARSHRSARAAAWVAELGGEPVHRMPLGGDPTDSVEQAVRTTACRNGRANKRRAARYLGWDPGTLAKHLRPNG